MSVLRIRDKANREGHAMHTPQRMTRSAFSLMEMLLALAIGMILLLALYLTLNTQIMHSRVGRETVAEGALARNVLLAIAADIRGQIATRDPRSLTDPSAAVNAALGTEPSMETPMPENPAVVFNAGVQGDK
jgi:type II secretory pathway component PulJ